MMRVALVALVCPLLAACSDIVAGGWPDRGNRAPEQMLHDVIVWQQHANVRESTGLLAHECFTDGDLAAFTAEDRSRKIVAHLRRAKDFAVIAAALRSLPRETLLEELAAAKRIARPTWRQMGFVDSAGRGQTEAGHQAELLIAGALVDAFAAAVRTQSASPQLSRWHVREPLRRMMDRDSYEFYGERYLL